MSTIAVVLIGKNEEALLSRCLDSVKDLGPIYFTDTGSTDKTIEIAKKYTDKISYFKWCDSFCKARNFAKKDVKEDYILSIDCDEYLHSVDEVRKAVEEAEKKKAIAVDVKMTAEDNGNTFLFPRLFKNSPQVWWNGAVHNTLSVTGEKIGNIEITFGYSPAHQKDPDRAFRILKKEVDSGKAGARELYYLGREYYYKRDYENAVIQLGKYVQASGFLAEKADAFLIMARCYWAMSMGEDARDACLQALKIDANFKEALLFMAEIVGDGRGNEKWQKNADMWKKLAESADNSECLFIRT